MRALVAWSLGIAAGIFGLTAGAGLTGSRWAAILIAAVVAGLVGLLVYRRPIVPLDEAACSPGLKAVSGLATIGALVQIARLAVFMIDPSQVGYSAVPTSQWEVQHSCLSAYFVSAQALSSAPNIYDDSLYSMPDDDPAGPRKACMIGPFKIDVFEYPPPFLLLPRALSPLVWLALPTLSVLQKGNVQTMVIAAAMLAMGLFERKRFAAGGVLLAFA